MLRPDLKSAIKEQLLKEAGVIADYTKLFGGTGTEDVNKDHYNHGVSAVQSDGNGGVTGIEKLYRPIDAASTVAAGVSMASLIANMLTEGRGKIGKLSNAGVLAGLGLWGGSELAGLIAPQKYSERKDVTGRLSDYGYRNFRDSDK